MLLGIIVLLLSFLLMSCATHCIEVAVSIALL